MPSELVAGAFQLHLVGQLLPNGLQRAGLVGRAGQQCLEPGPFFLTERSRPKGQYHMAAQEPQSLRGTQRLTVMQPRDPDPFTSLNTLWAGPQ